MREQIRKLIDEELQFINAIPDCDDFVDEKSAREYFVRKVEFAIRPQWVPVSERLPEHDLWDVITWGGNEMHVAFRQDARWVRSDGFILRDVTHWHTIDYPKQPEVHP